MNQGRNRSAHATVTIICCVLASICEGFDLQAAGVAAGGIRPEFHASLEQMQTFFAISIVGLFLGALVGGRLSDSFGRKRVLVGSIALFGLFSLLSPIAHDMQWLTWARFLTGLGLGGALPNLVALVNESSSTRRRSANVTLMYAGQPFGGAIASLISMTAATSHWRWIFVVGGVAPLLIAPLMQALMPESQAFERVHALEKSSSAGPEPSAANPKAGSFVAVLSGGRALPTALLWISFFMVLLVLYLILSWLPTLLVNSGLTKPQAAGVQVAFNVGGALAALLMGQLLEGRLRRLSIYIAIIALPLLLLLLSESLKQPSLVLIIVFGLGCAVLAAMAYLYAVAPSFYPTSIRGVGVGAAVAAGRLGSIVGPVLGGVLTAAGHSSARLFVDLLPIAIVGGVTALALTWLMQRGPSPAGLESGQVGG